MNSNGRSSQRERWSGVSGRLSRAVGPWLGGVLPAGDAGGDGPRPAGRWDAVGAGWRLRGRGVRRSAAAGRQAAPGLGASRRWRRKGTTGRFEEVLRDVLVFVELTPLCYVSSVG